MRNADSFLSLDERHPTRCLCYSGSIKTQWGRTNFMTRKAPIEHGINLEIYSSKIVAAGITRANFPTRVLTLPRKAFE